MIWMYLGDKIYEFAGTIPSSGTIVSNSGTYWDVATVDPDHTLWFEEVYGDEPLSDRNIPSHVVVNAYSENAGTIYVEENEHRTGDPHYHDPVEAKVANLKNGSQVQIKQAIEAQYLRIRTENGAASPATVDVNVRMQDEFQ